MKKPKRFKHFLAHLVKKNPVVLETFFGGKRNATLKESEDYDALQKRSAEQYKEVEDREHKNYQIDKHKGIISKHTEHSGTVNGHLVEHSKGKKDAISNHSLTHINKLDNAFNETKAKMTKDTHVYTGVHPDVVKHAKKEKSEHMTVHLPAYTSSTTAKHVAEDFARDNTDHDNKEAHVLHIKVKEGHPAMPIAKHSKHKEEHEVLLHRGTMLKVHKTPTTEKLKDGTTLHTWHAETIGHNPDKI